MWLFGRKKRIVSLAAGDRIEMSDGTTITLDEIVGELIDLRRDSHSLNGGVNRIERKLNRWLDVLNVREREPTNQVLAAETPGDLNIPPGNPDKEEISAGQETED